MLLNLRRSRYIAAYVSEMILICVVRFLFLLKAKKMQSMVVYRNYHPVGLTYGILPPFHLTPLKVEIGEPLSNFITCANPE